MRRTITGEPTTESRADPAAGAEDAEHREAPPWAGLAMVLVGLFMISVDVAIVNVAAPDIRADLGVSGSTLVLAVSGYTVAYAMLLITGARLGDDYGHRRLFLTGLAGFTLASLACGVAPSAAVLIAARIAQGAAGALMGPQVLSIIQTQFRGEAQKQAVPMYATVLAVGTVAGQIAGGALVTADLFGSGWRPVFLVNVPIGVALFAATRRWLAPSRGVAYRRPDPAGVVLVSSATLLVMLPLVLGREQGWPAWTYGSLATGLVALALSVGHMRRRAEHGGDPLVDLTFFRSAGVRRGLLSVLAMQIAYGGFLFSFALHLQAGLGHSPLRSGLTFAPFAAAFAVASLGFRRLPAGVQLCTPPIALGVLALGYAAVGMLARHGEWRGAATATLVIGGAGFGASFSPMVARTVSHTPPRLAPEASGLIGSIVQLGFVVGVATLGTWFVTSTDSAASDPGSAFANVTLAAAALAAIAAVVARAPGQSSSRRSSAMRGGSSDETPSSPTAET